MAQVMVWNELCKENVLVKTYLCICFLNEACKVFETSNVLEMLEI